MVGEWVGESKPRVIVFARLDMVPRAASDEWRRYLSTDPAALLANSGSGSGSSSGSSRTHRKGGGAPMFWVNGKTGSGVREVCHVNVFLKPPHFNAFAALSSSSSSSSTPTHTKHTTHTSYGGPSWLRGLT
jgi:hypothetical protein